MVNSTKLSSIILRYLLLLLLSVGNLSIFYLIATPLTVYPVLGAIELFYDGTLLPSTPTRTCEIFQDTFIQNIACMKTTIFFKDYFANIIPACIAGSAYYLLLILNLTTPMSRLKRIKSLFFLMFSFLFFNILRIFSFAMLFVNKNYEIFNIAHIASWYFGSTILVVILWFANVLIFKINSVPVYADIKMILNKIKGGK
ncbi:MAG: pacearchaeosortase [Nanoarchaeota archaeon]